MSTTPPVTDQYQYIHLPDGSYGKFAANATDDEIQGHIQKDFPDAFKDTSDTRNSLQKTFDTNTSPSPSDSLLQTGLKSATRMVGSPLIHPLQTLKSLPDSVKFPSADEIKAQTEDHNKPSLSQGIASGLGGFAGGMLMGKAAGDVIAPVAKAARNAAMEDPNVAAVRGLNVPPKSPKMLKTIGSVEGSRPYLSGATSLQDLQGKIDPAKAEIWSPYEQAVRGIGSRPVRGPGGMTTVADLEQERLQLSALNRGLKQQLPEAIRLAEQKGMSQAQLLAQERAVQNALDPELKFTGIDPKLIRKTFGQVADVGGRISGKSTIAEKPQPYGFGKIANISLEHPLQAPEQVLSGLRDMVAGRPLFRGNPTDINIREGFRGGGPKPNFGTYTPFQPAGQLQSPSIPLGAPPAMAGSTPPGYRPPPYYHDTTPMRTGRLLNPPPIQLGGRGGRVSASTVSFRHFPYAYWKTSPRTKSSADSTGRSSGGICSSTVPFRYDTYA